MNRIIQKLQKIAFESLPGLKIKEEVDGDIGNINALYDGLIIGNIQYMINNKKKDIYVDLVSVQSEYRNTNVFSQLIKKFLKLYKSKDEMINGEHTWSISADFANPYLDEALKQWDAAGKIKRSEFTQGPLGINKYEDYENWQQEFDKEYYKQNREIKKMRNDDKEITNPIKVYKNYSESNDGYGIGNVYKEGEISSNELNKLSEIAYVNSNNIITLFCADGVYYSINSVENNNQLKYFNNEIKGDFDILFMINESKYIIYQMKQDTNLLIEYSNQLNKYINMNDDFTTNIDNKMKRFMDIEDYEYRLNNNEKIANRIISRMKKGY